MSVTCVSALAQTRTQSAVVEARNITLPAGSNAVLPCHNQRIVWRQDRLRDRQRVVHWDVYRSRPHEGVERVLDLFPGGNERLYSNYNKGRISISPEAFNDGNFSLVIHSMETLSFFIRIWCSLVPICSNIDFPTVFT